MSQTTPQRPLVAIFWMLVTGLCFVMVTALVKYLGARMPATQSAFLRYFIGFLLLTPLFWRLRHVPVDRRLWIQFGARGVMHSLGVILWFFAMPRIPIADLTAINYLAPVYVTLGAALFLGEKLAFRRIAAVVAAVVGAVIVLRPGLREIGPGHWAMLAAALVFGGSYLLAKVTVDKAGPLMVNAMLTLLVTLALAPLPWAVWVPPTWQEIAVLCCVALFATAGHYTMTLAFAAAPVAVTQPVTFLQLIWATLLGVLVFGEALDLWVVVGGGVILGAVTFITWREAQLNRRAMTPPDTATRF